MKVNFYQTPQINNSRNINQRKQNSALDTGIVSVANDGDYLSPGLSLANFPNVSFMSKRYRLSGEVCNVDMRFLLNQAHKLRCAYSGLPMLAPKEFENICQKLAKRPNAQSAINFLMQYQRMMHNVEGIVFDVICDAKNKNKRDFQDILLELREESLPRLKATQKEVINQINPLIKKLSEPYALQLAQIRDEALSRIDSDEFERRDILRMVKSVNLSKASKDDYNKVISIYRKLYDLPKSGKDYDAFVVKYSKKSHFDIAKRLISTAVATIEHIVPSHRKGGNDLGNFILVSAQFNNERSSMPLGEYIMLNPEVNIPKHLQAYIDDVIKEMYTRDSVFASRSWYPDVISGKIEEETSGKVLLNTNALRLSKQQIKENSCLDRLGERFNVERRRRK